MEDPPANDKQDNNPMIHQCDIEEISNTNAHLLNNGKISFISSALSTGELIFGYKSRLCCTTIYVIINAL